MASSETTPEKENPEEEILEGKVEEESQGEGTPEKTIGASGASEVSQDEKIAELKKELEEIKRDYGESSKEAKRLAERVKELKESEEEEEEEDLGLFNREEEELPRISEKDYSQKSPEEILKEVEERAAKRALEEVEKRKKQEAEDRMKAKEIIENAKEKYPLLKTSKPYRRMVANTMDAEGIPIEEACERVNEFLDKANEGRGNKPFVEGAKGAGSIHPIETEEEKIRRSLRTSQTSSELRGL